jgi:hypothetical protein
MTLSDIKFNRQELAGSFGDIGTDFPLIIAMILAADLHTASVLIVFGLMQILTGVVYKMPMPVQPLKAMATLVIAQQIGGSILVGAGLAIGLVMLVLSSTGLLTRIARVVPKAVIRGIQLGLGLKLITLSFQKYIPDQGMNGYLLALFAFVLILVLLDNKKYPASLAAITLGVVFGLSFNVDIDIFHQAFGIHLPQLFTPTVDDVVTGFFLLALPQIPLSLGNSIIATKQVSEDLFPDRPPLTIKKIGLTYSFMNLVIPFFSGIPSCHGSGGMMGHYTFGGRTGGSVIIYGLFYLVLGLFFADGFMNIIQIFPLSVLGVLLVFEGLSLMVLSKDLVKERRSFVIALLVGVLAAGLPYGFVIAILIGTLIYYSPLKLNAIKDLGEQ